MRLVSLCLSILALGFAIAAFTVAVVDMHRPTPAPHVTTNPYLLP